MIFEFSSFGGTEYFLCSLILGVFLGVVYDVFRLVRIVLPKSNTLIFFEDILFCMIATISFLLLAFNFGSGQIRAFAAGGTLSGFTSYYCTLGKLVYRANEKIISFTKKIIKYIIDSIKKPIVFIAKKLHGFFEKTNRKRKRKKLIKKATSSAKKGFGLEGMIE